MPLRRQQRKIRKALEDLQACETQAAAEDYMQQFPSLPEPETDYVVSPLSGKERLAIGTLATAASIGIIGLGVNTFPHIAYSIMNHLSPY